MISSNSMVVIFKLKEKKSIGLNGGPQFSHNEGGSFVVDCETKAVIDYYWDK